MFLSLTQANNSIQSCVIFSTTYAAALPPLLVMTNTNKLWKMLASLNPFNDDVLLIKFSIDR